MNRQIQRTLAGAALCALLAVVLPAAALAAGPRFSDVPASHWAHEEIDRAAELGILQGVSDSRFGVGRQMTRAAFTVALCRFFGWETVQTTDGSYTDVQDPGAWYFGAVETARAHGALTGQSDTFRPNDAITREEIAVMLVRALGYGTIAGLAQDLPTPFTDVRSNMGYIAMAYELGLVSGTSATTFSPAQTATREQAAVMLMRLYDKLHAPADGRVAICHHMDGELDLAGYEALALEAKQLIGAGGVRLVNAMREETLASARAAAESAGVDQLLYIAGAASVLKSGTDEIAGLLAAAVEEGGYDGLYLDLPQLQGGERRPLTALARALDEKLGERAFYLAVEAPAWEGETYRGYDYAALGEAADRLVLRIAPYITVSNDFPTAPMEPLEEVYYALSALRDQVPGEKVSLLITTTGSAWRDGHRDGTLTASDIQALRESLFTETYTSERYACAYLTDASEEDLRVVWYHTGETVDQRAELLGFFGGVELCYTDVTSVADYGDYSLAPRQN